MRLFLSISDCNNKTTWAVNHNRSDRPYNGITIIKLIRELKEEANMYSNSLTKIRFSIDLQLVINVLGSSETFKELSLKKVSSGQ